MGERRAEAEKEGHREKGLRSGARDGSKRRVIYEHDLLLSIEGVLLEVPAACPRDQLQCEDQRRDVHCPGRDAPRGGGDRAIAIDDAEHIGRAVAVHP